MTKEQCDKCMFKYERCYILSIQLHNIELGTLIKCADYIWNGEL